MGEGCQKLIGESRYGAESRGEGDESRATYVEDGESLSLASIGVLLAQGDQLLGQTLGFLGLGPCCGYRLVLEEGCDEVSEQSLTVRAAARQMSVFLESACHVFFLSVVCCRCGAVGESSVVLFMRMYKLSEEEILGSTEGIEQCAVVVAQDGRGMEL